MDRCNFVSNTSGMHSNGGRPLIDRVELRDAGSELRAQGLQGEGLDEDARRELRELRRLPHDQRAVPGADDDRDRSGGWTAFQLEQEAPATVLPSQPEIEHDGAWS